VYSGQLDGSEIPIVQFGRLCSIWYSGVLVIVGAIYLSDQLFLV
jgi:hypothetical protein